MADMIKQITSFFLWASLVLYGFAAATTEVPMECTVGTPEYNETICSETCTKDVHVNQPYCSNYTKTASTTESKPQQQEAHNPIATPEVTSPQEVMRNVDLSTPLLEVNDKSSGISLRSSLIFGVSSFLLCGFLI